MEPSSHPERYFCLFLFFIWTNPPRCGERQKREGLKETRHEAAETQGGPRGVTSCVVKGGGGGGGCIPHICLFSHMIETQLVFQQRHLLEIDADIN